MLLPFSLCVFTMDMWRKDHDKLTVCGVRPMMGHDHVCDREQQDRQPHRKGWRRARDRGRKVKRSRGHMDSILNRGLKKKSEWETMKRVWFWMDGHLKIKREEMGREEEIWKICWNCCRCCRHRHHHHDHLWSMWEIPFEEWPHSHYCYHHHHHHPCPRTSGGPRTPTHTGSQMHREEEGHEPNIWWIIMRFVSRFHRRPTLYGPLVGVCGCTCVNALSLETIMMESKKKLTRNWCAKGDKCNGGDRVSQSNCAAKMGCKITNDGGEHTNDKYAHNETHIAIEIICVCFTFSF